MTTTHHRSRRVLIAGVLSLSLVAAAQTAYATSITYNNFGSGDSYDQTTGWRVGNTPPGVNFAVAETFTPSASGTLASIVLALQFGMGTNAATVSLNSDSGGKPDGVLESFAVSNLPNFDGSYHTPLTLNDTLNVLLTAGTPYWIVVSTASTNVFSWEWNSIGASDTHATSGNGGAAWTTAANTQAAFRVTQNDVGAPVPEPTSLVLLATGLVGVGLRRHRPCRPGTKNAESRRLSR